MLSALVYLPGRAQDMTASFDPLKMRERVKRLSADDFEGRGPGTAGGNRAARYIAGQLRASGVKPGNKGSYFQNVKLAGMKPDPGTRLDVIDRSGRPHAFRFGEDFVATSGVHKASVPVDAELVFMGYGIDAPLYDWNDYSGPPQDYRGKILLILVNDPPATSAEPTLFGGKALTYYGRWTYKYEEAARRGAAGVILIHTDQSAGYGWNVVRSSWGGWGYQIARTARDKTPTLSLKSWVTNSAADKMLKLARLDLTALKRRAAERGFRPVKTGLHVRSDLRSQIRTVSSPNVLGVVEGSDPALKKEYVIFTSHWDHLGIGDPDATGDKIYNGAYDNSSGVAAVLGIADVLAKMPRSRRPKRSVLFLFTTAEEQGLLGAEYYVAHPVVPLRNTAGNVNIDGVNFYGMTRDFSALGSERSTAYDVVQKVARERRMILESDTLPEQGYFFRSDHFPFAKAGIPAVSLRHGDDFVKPLSREAAIFARDYQTKYYHQAADEFREWWDFAAMVQQAEIGLAIGMGIADLPHRPRYHMSDEFYPADARRSGK